MLIFCIILAGFLTYPWKATFPSYIGQWHKKLINYRIHSSGHYSGFSPDSLLCNGWNLLHHQNCDKGRKN